MLALILLINALARASPGAWVFNDRSAPGPHEGRRNGLKMPTPAQRREKAEGPARLASH